MALTSLEKEEVIRKLAAFRGKLHSDKTDEEIGMAAIKRIAKKLNMSLD